MQDGAAAKDRDQWRSMYQEAALSTFTRLLNDDALADVRFELADGEFFPAHKVVLAARSPYWHTMFCGSTAASTREGTSGLIRPDCSAAALKIVLRHVYTFARDESLFPVDDKKGLLSLEVAYLADQYQLKELSEGCLQYQLRRLSVSSDDTPCSACSLLEGARKFGLSTLEERTTGFIMTNPDHVLKSEDLLQLQLRSLAEFVQNKEFVPSSEILIFSAVVRYADRHAGMETVQARRSFASHAFSGIRFSQMRPRDVADTVAASGWLRDAEMLALLLFLNSNGKRGSAPGPAFRRPRRSCLRHASLNHDFSGIDIQQPKTTYYRTETQVYIVQQLQRNIANEETVWYVVSSKWWNQWCSHAEEGSNLPSPGIISNRGLYSIEPNLGARLQEGLEIEKDYKLVDRVTFAHLRSWYGTHETVLACAAYGRRDNLEIRPHKVSVFKSSEPDLRSNALVRRTESVLQVKVRLCEWFEVAVANVQLWQVNKTAGRRMDEDDSQSIEVDEGNILVLREKKIASDGVSLKRLNEARSDQIRGEPANKRAKKD